MCRGKRGSSPIAAPRRGAARAGGSTHGLAVSAGGPFLPRQPRGAGGAGGAGDWLQHCAIAVPRGGAGLSGLAFLALGAGIAKASAALGSGGKGVRPRPAARPLCPPPRAQLCPAALPSSPGAAHLDAQFTFLPLRDRNGDGWVSHVDRRLRASGGGSPQQQLCHPPSPPWCCPSPRRHRSPSPLSGHARPSPLFLLWGLQTRERDLDTLGADTPGDSHPPASQHYLPQAPAASPPLWSSPPAVGSPNSFPTRHPLPRAGR